MSDVPEVYVHSGRWTLTGALMPLAVLLVLSVPASFIYAYGISWSPFVYVNFFATIFFGFGLGWVGSKLVKIGRVRNQKLSFLIGLVIGCMALYGTWVAHISIIFGSDFIVLNPMDLFEIILSLNQSGTWSIFGDTPVTGVLLAIVWLVEAGMILLIPALTIYAEISDTPYCEEESVWLDQRLIIDTVAVCSDEDMALVKQGDLSPLARARARSIQDPAWMRLTLKFSDKTEQLYTITVGSVYVAQNKDGELEEHAQDHTEDLMLNHQEFEIVKQFADWPISQAAAPEMEEVQPAAQATDLAADEPEKS